MAKVEIIFAGEALVSERFARMYKRNNLYIGPLGLRVCPVSSWEDVARAGACLIEEMSGTTVARWMVKAGADVAYAISKAATDVTAVGQIERVKIVRSPVKGFGWTGYAGNQDRSFGALCPEVSVAPVQWLKVGTDASPMKWRVYGIASRADFGVLLDRDLPDGRVDFELETSYSPSNIQGITNYSGYLTKEAIRPHTNPSRGWMVANMKLPFRAVLHSMKDGFIEALGGSSAEREHASAAWDYCVTKAPEYTLSQVGANLTASGFVADPGAHSMAPGFWEDDGNINFREREYTLRPRTFLVNNTMSSVLPEGSTRVALGKLSYANAGGPDKADEATASRSNVWALGELVLCSKPVVVMGGRSVFTRLPSEWLPEQAAGNLRAVNYVLPYSEVDLSAGHERLVRQLCLEGPVGGAPVSTSLQKFLAREAGVLGADGDGRYSVVGETEEEAARNSAAGDNLLNVSIAHDAAWSYATTETGAQFNAFINAVRKRMVDSA